MKKFNLTNKEKQLLHMSFAYLCEWRKDCIQKKDKDVEKIYVALNRLSNAHIETWTEDIENALKFLTKIAKGSEIECNGLILTIGFVSVFASIAKIDNPLAEKILSISNRIYDKAEKILGKTEGFKRANEVVKAFTKSKVQIGVFYGEYYTGKSKNK